MGYQHVWPMCEQNIQESVDELWVMHTIRCFEKESDGSPRFDAYTVMQAINDGIAYLAKSGMDAAIVLMCNNYILDRDSLYAQAEAMLLRNEPFAWYYRADQLKDQLFGPSVRLPWLVNLRHKADLHFSVDCLIVDDKIHNMERGNYTAAPLVMDVQLEMTREDLAEKMNFIRCYADLVPKRSPVFDWGYWFPYYVKKFQQKQRRDVPLTETGRQIAEASRPDFVSHAVLEAMA